jgi:hypothetical protein
MPRRIAALAALPTLAGPAAAHSPVPGIEGFYTGLAHPFVEPALLVASLSMVFLILQDWPHRFRLGWPVYAGTLLVGLAASRSLAAALPLDALLLGAACACAIAAALAGDRLTWLALPLIGLGGLVVGAAALPEPGPPRDVAITTAGTVAGANLGLLVIGGAIDWLRQRHDGLVLRIGIRVAASWLAAIAVMLLAFVLRPDAG